MALIIGKVGPFDEAVETWESYTERLGQYFIANDVHNDLKVPSLLSIIGPRHYTLLKNLCAPVKPAAMTFDELIKKLTDHLSPRPSEIAERFRFHKREQGAGETVTVYIAELRRLAIHCDFGDTLDKTLRDRFVCGLKQEHIQKKLLAEPKLTLERAIQTAVAMETASRDALELQGKRETVHKLTVNKPRNSTYGKQKTHKTPFKPVMQGKCYRCGGDHKAKTCKHLNTKCRYCDNPGHLEKVCFKKQRDSNGGKVHYVDEETSDDSDEYEHSSYLLHFGVNKVSVEPIMVTPRIEGVEIPMELDTGAAVSIISKANVETYFKKYNLLHTNAKLKTYSGEEIQPAGKLKVMVELNNQKETLDLLVVNNEGPTLMGRNWLQQLKLNWKEIKSIRCDEQNVKVKAILDKHKKVFEPGIGKLKDMRGKLTLQDGASPKFCKAREVAYSLRPRVEEELDRLQQAGVISPVKFSDWATPIVPLPKANGKVRICGDYKVTLNPAMKIEQYPLPKIADIFASLGGGQKFSKIDLTQAYLQMEVDEVSRNLLTINTHKGLFCFNRLPFGIASAPAIWQRAMDQVLTNIPKTKCILDDMIITGSTDEEHLQNLSLVLQRLEQYGLRANLDKCQFFKDQISYCGHVIDKAGLHKSNEKTNAVENAPTPENVSQLRSFLGLVNYYHRFLPNLATVVGPLNELLQNNKKWTWTAKCDDAFAKVKELITSEQVLCHYNPTLPVRLATDASPYGIGAVLSHVMEDGTERPIAYASRSLTKAEKAYSQIDKEALSIYWGVQKFHTYLYGRHFTLITDHKPLVSIFHPEKQLPAMTTARLQRYAIFLSSHNYSIEYRNTANHGNADGLSRLPLSAPSTSTDEETDACNVFYSSQFENLPVTCDTVRKETQRDPVLSQVLDIVLQGTRDFPPENDFKTYRNRSKELTAHQNCLLWGNRVVIPATLRSEILTELHKSHPGIVRTKSLARSYVWWPTLDSDIEEMCQHCVDCQQYLPKPEAAPVHPWEWTGSPWERVHVDFAGPFKGQMYFILVDSHSKWPEVVRMSSTTATATINVLRDIFAHLGLPKTLVSDNGPQFVADEFKTFLRQNGVKHVTSSPYHPRTNGLAERFVRSFKAAMKKHSKITSKEIDIFLMTYRVTPHATTGETPAKLLMGRNLRTRLDLLKPDTSNKVRQKQDKMKLSKHTGSNVRQFTVGQSVMVRDYRGSVPWILATVTSCLGPLTYEVKTKEEGVWRRHVDQMRRASETLTEKTVQDTLRQSYSEPMETPAVPFTYPTGSPEVSDRPSSPLKVPDTPKTDRSVVSKSPVEPRQAVLQTPTAERRYPTRIRKPTERLITVM